MSHGSLEGAPADSHTISSAYYCSILDPIIEIARAVAHDFVKRPRLYRGISQHLADLLEGFRIRTGSAPEWMSAAQRAELACGIFNGVFSAGAIELRTAAVSLVEQGTAENRGLLLIPFRDSTHAFRAFLHTLKGSGTELAARHMRTVFDSAVEVLHSDTIAQRFGLVSTPEDLAGSDGAYLIEEIQRTLRLKFPNPPLSQNRVTLLQRVARYGADTIAGVLKGTPGEESEEHFETLLQNTYSWEKALQQLLFMLDTVRAWKDPAYRGTLSAGERAMIPPHPSGEISLDNTQLDPAVAKRALSGLGFSTYTLVAICCSTGDLPCTLGSEGSGYCCPTNTGFTCPVTDCGSDCRIA